MRGIGLVIVKGRHALSPDNDVSSVLCEQMRTQNLVCQVRSVCQKTSPLSRINACIVSSAMSGSASAQSGVTAQSGSLKAVKKEEEVTLIIMDTTSDVKRYEVKADRNVTGDKIVKVIRRQRSDTVHEETYKNVNGYMTGKFIEYHASGGEQKMLWSSETAGTGKKLEGISQSADGHDVIVELRVRWHPERPEDVKASGLARDVISLEETDEEEEVSGPATLAVMAQRDEKVEDVSQEFGIFRDRVHQYVESRLLRSEKASSLA